VATTPTRTKGPKRGVKYNKAGRRLPPKVRSGRDILVLPIAVGGVLAALFIGIIVYGVVSSANSKPASAAGIPCDQLQHSQVHYHAAVQIVYLGNQVHIPANIGIVGTATAPTCYYWLHVHAANQDVIHIESPAQRVFTLGDFFQVWSAWQGTPEPLDAKHVSTFAIQPGQKLVVYVDAGDGKGPQLYDSDPKKIVLTSHKVITLEITPPTVSPPPAFTFPSGL